MNRDKKRNKELLNNTLKYFSILTPKNPFKSEDIKEEKKEDDEKKE